MVGLFFIKFRGIGFTHESFVSDHSFVNLLRKIYYRNSSSIKETRPEILRRFKAAIVRAQSNPQPRQHGADSDHLLEVYK